ncbi:MAG TPA: hypothetical protein VFM10_01665 [Terriglobales bacterium]|nr:hypothetical protein [Terriglobales bacterium]
MRIGFGMMSMLAALSAIGNEYSRPVAMPDPDMLATRHSPRKGGPAHCVNSGVPAARRAAEKRRAVRARSKK